MDCRFNQLVAYLRIPKTGSSSLIKAVEQTGIKIAHYQTSGRKAFWVINNDQIAEITPNQLKNYHVIATIRNPLSRFMSGWRFCLHMGWIPPHMNPLEFLQAICDKKTAAFTQGVFYHVIMPQSDWLFHDDQLICDNIIQMESFESDLQYTMRYLGLSDIIIGHEKNSANDPKYCTNAFYFTKYPDLIDLHREVFEQDWRKLPYD